MQLDMFSSLWKTLCFLCPASMKMLSPSWQFGIQPREKGTTPRVACPGRTLWHGSSGRAISQGLLPGDRWPSPAPGQPRRRGPGEAGQPWPNEAPQGPSSKPIWGSVSLQAWPKPAFPLPLFQRVKIFSFPPDCLHLSNACRLIEVSLSPWLPPPPHQHPGSLYQFFF